MPSPLVSCARSNVSTVSVNSEFIQDDGAAITWCILDGSLWTLRCAPRASLWRRSAYQPGLTLGPCCRAHGGERVAPTQPNVLSRQRETAKIQAEMKALSRDDDSCSSCCIKCSGFCTCCPFFLYSQLASPFVLCSTRSPASACKLLGRPSFAKWFVGAS